MFVKPKSDQKHPDPAFRVMKIYDPALGNYLPPEGREVGNDREFYWHRHVQSGDVEVLTADQAKASLAEADRAAKEAKAQAAPGKQGDN